jgi:hypothetical protein
MTNKKGALWLIPNTLGGESLSDIIPADVSAIAISLRTFFVEEMIIKLQPNKQLYFHQDIAVQEVFI